MPSYNLQNFFTGMCGCYAPHWNDDEHTIVKFDQVIKKGDLIYNIFNDGKKDFHEILECIKATKRIIIFKVKGSTFDSDNDGMGSIKLILTTAKKDIKEAEDLFTEKYIFIPQIEDNEDVDLIS